MYDWHLTKVLVITVYEFIREFFKMNLQFFLYPQSYTTSYYIHL